MSRGRPRRPGGGEAPTGGEGAVPRSRGGAAPAARAGRRRGWAGARLAALLLALAPAAVAGAAWTALHDGGAGGGTASPLAVGTPAVEAIPDAAPPPEPAAAPPPAGDRAPEVRLSGVDAFHVRLRKPPRAGLVIDVDSGDVLWRRRPLARLPIASLTKIMTALVVTARAAPGEPVRITPAALRYRGSGVGLLPRGRRVRLETLLNGLLIVSGNDAAIALAVHVAGGERRFVALMNRRARDLGLGCTRFASSHGLEDGNRSCPRDLAVLTRLAMARPRIARIVRRKRASFRFPIEGGRLHLTGHNPLHRLGYRGAIGLKTGFTHAAGRCFVGVARRRGRTLAAIVLDSPDPGRQAARLLNAGFRRR